MWSQLFLAHSIEAGPAPSSGPATHIKAEQGISPYGISFKKEAPALGIGHGPTTRDRMWLESKESDILIKKAITGLLENSQESTRMRAAKTPRNSGEFA